MIIRKQQVNLFSDASLETFKDRMAEHLRRCFPSECEALGDEGIQNTIRYGIERASSHGIDLERDVCKYIDLMFTFGRDFDSDLNYSWAADILHDETLDNSTMKAERLFAAARREQESTSGEVG
jgi:hypothetical protein